MRHILLSTNNFRIYMIPHFMHRAMHYCQGYQKFLDNLQFGKQYQFNTQYFFFSIFWLVRHKLYALYYGVIAVSMSLMFLAHEQSNHNLDETIILYFQYLFLFHLLMSFFSHKFYFVHLDTKFAKVGYDYEKCLKIATPYPLPINFCIHILIPFSAIKLLQFIVLILKYV